MHSRKIIILLALISIFIVVSLIGCAPKTITADWEKTIMQLQDDLLKKEQEIKDLQKEASPDSTTIENNQKEIASLKQEVLSLQNTLEEKQKEISKMNDTISSLESALSEATQDTVKEIKTTTSESKASETTATTTTATETTQAPASGYFEVFSFSGNGIKSSESFTIHGSKFKIAYNCSGDLSQAFLYKANGDLVNLVVSTAGPANDETVFRGSGTYYIEANMMGDFSMVVYDYR